MSSPEPRLRPSCFCCRYFKPYSSYSYYNKMKRLKKYCLLLLVALLVAPVVMASGVRDDDDKDPSIRPGIRRLHPERERAKAMKKL